MFLILSKNIPPHAPCHLLLLHQKLIRAITCFFLLISLLLSRPKFLYSNSDTECLMKLHYFQTANLAKLLNLSGYTGVHCTILSICEEKKFKFEGS